VGQSAPARLFRAFFRRSCWCLRPDCFLPSRFGVTIGSWGGASAAGLSTAAGAAQRSCDCQTQLGYYHKAQQACAIQRRHGAGVWHDPLLPLFDRHITIWLTRANFGGCRLCIAVTTPVSAFVPTAIVIAAVGCCCRWHICLPSLASCQRLSRRQRLQHGIAFCAFCTPACCICSVLLLLLLKRLRRRLLASTEAQLLHAAADAAGPASTIGHCVLRIATILTHVFSSISPDTVYNIT
jgi:hypothetical protein